MSAKFIDFDELWAAEDAAVPAPTIKVFGETIELPRGVPAKVFLVQARHADTESITLEIVTDVLEPYVGRERVGRWIEQGVTTEQLLGLSSRLRRIYTEEDEPAPGEADAPATMGASATSSKDGGTSSPTSDASTSFASTPPSSTA